MNETKYRIVGVDGKVYGPIGLEQLRQWLAEGRIEGRTPVFVDGTSQWTVLDRLPEFVHLAPAGATAAPVASAPARARGTNGFAVSALICALLSWVCCCCCVPFNLFAIVFALIALVQISQQPEPQEGRLFAILALLLVLGNILVLAFALVLQVLTNSDVFSG